MSRRPPSPKRQAGFTLVEVAVVAGVIGILAFTMTSAFEGMEQARRQNGAQAHAEAGRMALRTFALRNKRLPCPDNSIYGDSGREAAGTGTCPTGLNMGWLPYESLGLDTPPRPQRLRYGVYRGPNADLVAPVPAASDASDGPDMEGTSGFTRALVMAAAATPLTSQPHYYASSAVTPSAACAGSDLTTPAFVLIAPATDRDDDGGDHPGFDAPNLGFVSGGSTCFAAPDRPADPFYDDVVATESATSLLGWLASITR